MSTAGLHTDATGRTYVTTLSKAEWEAERAKSDEVHVVLPQPRGGAVAE